MTEPLPLPFDGYQTPHVIIEVNQRCNISCRACYKHLSSYRKPLDQIIEEIDLARGARALDLITFAGGEPTLHPDLPKAIQYASRFAKTNVLSNGLALSSTLLRKLKAAGLTLLCVHVDSLQRRPDAPPGASERDLNDLREGICRRIRKAGIGSALSVTLYKSGLGELSHTVDYLFSSNAAKGLLITCYRDFPGLLDRVRRSRGRLRVLDHDYETGSRTVAEEHLLADSVRIAGDSRPDEMCTAEDVHRILDESFGLQPDFFLASNRDQAARRWLVYLVIALTARDGRYRLLPISTRAKRLFALLDRVTTAVFGRHRFLSNLGPWTVLALVVLSGLLSWERGFIARTLRFLSGLLTPGARLHLKDIVAQQGPEVANDGELEYCRSCPDATVRGGRLVPVCIADILMPLDEHRVQHMEASTVAAAVESVAECAP